MLTAALAACGCKPDARPKTAAPDSRDATAAADAGTTGAKMNADTTIPMAAYRVAAGPDGLWAWAGVGAGAVVLDGAGRNDPIGGTVPATTLAFSADGATLSAGPARVDVATGTVSAPVGKAQFGAGFTGKAELSYVSGYELRAAAWAAGGDLLIISLTYRPQRREQAPPPSNFPTQRLLAFDAAGALVADMGRTSHPLIAVGKDRVFATGGLTIDNWSRADLTKPNKKIPAKAGISALVLAPDEARLAYAWNGGVRGDATATGTVVLWDIAGASSLVEWRADSHVTDVAWHPGGAIVATAGDEGVKLWKLDGAATTQASAPVTEPATAVAFTPDGDELVVALGGRAPKVVRVEATP